MIVKESLAYIEVDSLDGSVPYPDLHMQGDILVRGPWAPRPDVVPLGVSHSSPSLGDVNPTLDELKALLGTTLELREAAAGDQAANWFADDGELIRWVGGNATLVAVVLDLFASRTESDLGIAVDRIWRPVPRS